MIRHSFKYLKNKENHRTNVGVEQHKENLYVPGFDREKLLKSANPHLLYTDHSLPPTIYLDQYELI
jgi:hypothetical protein